MSKSNTITIRKGRRLQFVTPQNGKGFWIAPEDTEATIGFDRRRLSTILKVKGVGTFFAS